MANRIKGITVESGGDTTKLQTALKGVNSEIKNTQSQLKDVEKLLKLDPGNTELLAQKHRLLGDVFENCIQTVYITKLYPKPIQHLPANNGRSGKLISFRSSYQVCRCLILGLLHFISGIVQVPFFGKTESVFPHPLVQQSA